eukprot:1158787-Pelagomonas_calceolata.AAC.3
MHVIEARRFNSSAQPEGPQLLCSSVALHSQINHSSYAVHYSTHAVHQGKKNLQTSSPYFLSAWL